MATFVVKDSEIRLEGGTDFADTSDEGQKTFMSVLGIGSRTTDIALIYR